MLPYTAWPSFLGFLGQGPELFCALSAYCFPFLPTPQGLLYLCLATGSTSSGISLCQIQLLERPFFFS